MYHNFGILLVYGWLVHMTMILSLHHLLKLVPWRFRLTHLGTLSKGYVRGLERRILEGLEFRNMENGPYISVKMWSAVAWSELPYKHWHASSIWCHKSILISINNIHSSPTNWSTPICLICTMELGKMNDDSCRRNNKY